MPVASHSITANRKLRHPDSLSLSALFVGGVRPLGGIYTVINHPTSQKLLQKRAQQSVQAIIAQLLRFLPTVRISKTCPLRQPNGTPNDQRKDSRQRIIELLIAQNSHPLILRIRIAIMAESQKEVPFKTVQVEALVSSGRISC